MAVKENQAELEGYAKGRKLHEQLERSGAYERIKNRRGAQLLQAYLPTQVSIGGANQTLEKPYSNEISAALALHRAMKKAFSHLDEQTREEYGSPEAALQPRTQTGLITGGRRGHAALIEACHQGTYTGKPLGGSESQEQVRVSDDPGDPGNESADHGQPGHEA